MGDIADDHLDRLGLEECEWCGCIEGQCECRDCEYCGTALSHQEGSQ